MPAHALSTQRRSLLRELADRVPTAADSPATLVAVDGVDGAGKSVFADQLAEEIAALRRPVIRASVDDFHRPRAARHRRGKDSPSGFWADSFDLEQLRGELLDPLSPGGSGRFRTAVHDVHTDEAVQSCRRTAVRGSVLVLDGLFLHRDELCGYWHLSVLLDVPFDVSVARMTVRDGSPADPEHPDLRRYVGGQRLYFAACNPSARADVVVDNRDWDRPAIRGRA